jgi:hypothetical protein
MEGTGEIKYPGQTKSNTAALRLTEGSVKARRRKSRRKNHLVLQVGGCAKGKLPVHGKHLLAKNSQRRNGTGQLYGCRRKQVQRNTSNKLRNGTWNVKMLIKAGNMEELAEELVKTQLEIVAIKEIKWSRTGFIKKNDFIILQWN